jgi:hypothetical protein
MDRWKKRWVVESNSGHGQHIVALDLNDQWGCDCKGWTMHVRRFCLACGKEISKHDKVAEGLYRCYWCNWEGEPKTERVDCSHIREVKAGGGKTLGDAVIDILR